MLVEKPGIVLCSGFLLVIGCIVATVMLGLMEISENIVQNWLVHDDIKVANWDMLTASNNFFQESREGEDIALRAVEMEDWNVVLIFNNLEGDSLMEMEKLQKIKEIEAKI